MSNHSSKVLPLPILIEDAACIPIYSTHGAAGADVKAYIQEEIIIPAGKVALIPTGIKMEIPSGYEIQVRPRSGLALKHQITVLNTPGTIDEDYRGEVKVILMNHGEEDFTVTPGMRIAQLILAPVVRAEFVVQTELGKTVRDAGGFGHTGKG